MQLWGVLSKAKVEQEEQRHCLGRYKTEAE
jgi:hypothetical protein